MQYICYTPSGEGAGNFYFPSIAVLRYLEELVLAHGMADHAISLKELLILTRSFREFIHIETGRLSMDFYAADMVDRGVFTVVCPHCQQHYSASHIVCLPWQQYGQYTQHGGRSYHCPLGHELLRVQDYIA